VSDRKAPLAGANDRFLGSEVLLVERAERQADESGGQGITITIISRGPGVETVVQKFRIDKRFMLPEPGPADSKN
jgi:hypothetical protein